MSQAISRPVSLVTGAAGFIASHLCESLLARGHRVIGLDGLTDSYDLDQKRANLETLRQHEGFEFVEAHLMDADLDMDPMFEDVEYVFHLASGLMELLLDAGRRMRMGTAARRHAATAFDLEGMRAATRALYAEAIGDAAA